MPENPDKFSGFFIYSTGRNVGKDNKMRGLRKVLLKVSLSFVVLLTIASIIGIADVVQAAFTTASEVKTHRQ